MLSCGASSCGWVGGSVSLRVERERRSQGSLQHGVFVARQGSELRSCVPGGRPCARAPRALQGLPWPRAAAADRAQSIASVDAPEGNPTRDEEPKEDYLVMTPLPFPVPPCPCPLLRSWRVSGRCWSTTGSGGASWCSSRSQPHGEKKKSFFESAGRWGQAAQQSSASLAPLNHASA